MNSKPFLITGATGSIGRNVVEFLLERGHKVRAFVHKGENNEQSSQLQQLGAEIGPTKRLNRRVQNAKVARKLRGLLKMTDTYLIFQILLVIVSRT